MSIQLCAQAVDLSPRNGVELTSLELKRLQGLRKSSCYEEHKAGSHREKDFTGTISPVPPRAKLVTVSPRVLCAPELHLGTWPGAALYRDRNRGC